MGSRAMGRDHGGRPVSADGETYLGDGLYASFDGWYVRLWATNGAHVTNEVFLEPAVLHALDQWRTNMEAQK